jgi:hypothetical protein
MGVAIDDQLLVSLLDGEDHKASCDYKFLGSLLLPEVKL